MRNELLELWDSIESRKWRVMEAVARMPEEVQHQARGGSWSPVQVLQHLVKAEEVMLQETEAASMRTGAPVRNWKHRAAVWIMRKGIRVPPASTMLPEGEADLRRLGQRWDEIRTLLREKLEASRDDRPFSVNRFMGPLSADMALELTDSHLEYHQRQLGG